MKDLLLKNLERYERQLEVARSKQQLELSNHNFEEYNYWLGVEVTLQHLIDDLKFALGINEVK